MQSKYLAIYEVQADYLKAIHCPGAFLNASLYFSIFGCSDNSVMSYLYIFAY